MFTIKPLPQFTAWLDGLTDESSARCNCGPHQAAGTGFDGGCEAGCRRISELRVHAGAGWRIYLMQRGDQLIVLLSGGSKRTQKNDIKRAKALAALLD